MSQTKEQTWDWLGASGGEAARAWERMLSEHSGVMLPIYFTLAMNSLAEAEEQHQKVMLKEGMKDSRPGDWVEGR